jgi:hypothetical protein
MDPYSLYSFWAKHLLNLLKHVLEDSGGLLIVIIALLISGVVLEEGLLSIYISLRIIADIVM